MNATWMIPFIILGGALQTCGAAMNNQLYKHMINPWLASAISAAVVALLLCCGICSQAETAAYRAGHRVDALVGSCRGLVGAVQVYAGLTLVHKVGAGTFMALTVTAALIMSLLIDHFGWLRVHPHPVSPGRILGGVLMICGIALIAKF